MSALVVRPEGIERVRQLRKQTPSPRQVRVAGKLDAIRHTGRRFTLLLRDASINGIAESRIRDSELTALWGQPVLITGQAVFRPSGTLLRIEAEQIAPATDTDQELWSETPMPLDAGVALRALHRPQGPRSGLSAVFGGWPGNETDEEIRAILEEVS